MNERVCCLHLFSLNRYYQWEMMRMRDMEVVLSLGPLISLEDIIAQCMTLIITCTVLVVCGVIFNGVFLIILADIPVIGVIEVILAILTFRFFKSLRSLSLLSLRSLCFLLSPIII